MEGTRSAYKILIIGGTGMLGHVLVKRLLALGKEVHVMTRTPGKHEELLTLGAKLIEGDLTDKSSLINACAGKDLVIAAAHAILGKGKYSSKNVDDIGHHALIDAAKQQAVSHFIYMSIQGTEPNHPIDFWRTKLKVESYLLNSGLNYHIIRSAAFMELHVYEMFGKAVEKKGRAMIMGKGANPVNYVSIQNVAELMIYCVEHTDKPNQVYEIGGLDNISRKEMARLYAMHANRKLKSIHIPRGVLKFMAKVMKPFHPGISRVLQIAVWSDQTDQTFDVRPLLNRVPIQITRIEDFIKSG